MTPMEYTPIVVAVVAAAGGFVGAVAVRRSFSANVDVNGLLDRIGELERKVNVQAEELRKSRNELERLTGLEEGMRLQLSARDRYTAALEDRIARLETWVRAQGADPDEIAPGRVRPSRPIGTPDGF